MADEESSGETSVVVDECIEFIEFVELFVPLLNSHGFGGEVM